MSTERRIITGQSNERDPNAALKAVAGQIQGLNYRQMNDLASNIRTRLCSLSDVPSTVPSDAHVAEVLLHVSDSILAR